MKNIYTRTIPPFLTGLLLSALPFVLPGLGRAQQPLAQASAAATPRSYTFNTPGNPTGFSEQDVARTHSSIYGPGRNHGNSGGWTTFHLANDTIDCWRRGICQASTLLLNKASVGDAMAAYWYVHCASGLAAESDEGCGGLGWLVSENGYFHGHLTAGTSGARSLQPVFDSGENEFSDGAFLLDISRPAVAAQLAGDSRPVPETALPGGQDTLLNALPVAGASLPLTRSWCTAIAEGDRSIVPDPKIAATGSVAITLSCQVRPVGGVYRPLEPGIVSVAGQNYPEQASLIAAGPLNPQTHVQSLTLQLRNPNRSLAIFQGGLAGTFCNSDSDLAETGQRQSYYAFGSLTGHDLIYGYNLFGSLVERYLPVKGASTWQKNSARAGFHCYPGAEITSVADGGHIPTLEPNNVAWSAGDLIENPHYPAHGGKGGSLAYSQETPCDPSSSCDALDVFAGGKGFVGNAHLLLLQNTNLQTYYLAGGGAWTAPPAIEVPGSYGTFGEFAYAPQVGFRSNHAAVFHFQNRAGYVAGKQQGSNAPIDLFEFGWSTRHMGFDPAADRYYIDSLKISGETEVPDPAPHTASHAIASTNYVDRAVQNAVHGFTGDKTSGTCTFHIVDGLIQSVTGC